MAPALAESSSTGEFAPEVDPEAPAGLPLFLRGAWGSPGGGPPLDPRPGIGSAGDPFEREAERVATLPIHAIPPAAGLPKPAASSLAPAPGPGRALPGPVRSQVEPVVGMNLGHVVVHDDLTSHLLAGLLGARAFTTGHHIWLGPDAGANDHSLLAHESVHVAQQAGAGPTSARKVERPPAVQRQEAPRPPAAATPTPVAGPSAANTALSSDPTTSTAAQGNAQAMAQVSQLDKPATPGEPKAPAGGPAKPGPGAPGAGQAQRGAEGAAPAAAGPQGNAAPGAGGPAAPGAAGAGPDAGSDTGGGEGLDATAAGPADADAQASGIATLGTGDIALIDTELAEHERWGKAKEHVGAAGSLERAEFAVEAAGGGALSGFASGAAMGLGIGLIARAAKPIPGVGAVLGGLGAAKDLFHDRDWSGTAATIGKFGEGNDTYETLANSLAAVSEVITVISNVLNLVNGVVGVLQIVVAGLLAGSVVLTIVTLGAASPAAVALGEAESILLEISEAISAVTTVLDGINNGLLQPCILLFRVMHTFTSPADPREVELQAQGIEASASAAAAVVGGRLGGEIAESVGQKGPPQEGDPPHSSPKAEDPVPPAAGEGPGVKFGEPAPGEAPSTPASAPSEATPTGTSETPLAPTGPGVEERPTVPAPSPTPEVVPPVPEPSPHPAVPPPAMPDVENPLIPPAPGVPDIRVPNFGVEGGGSPVGPARGLRAIDVEPTTPSAPSAAPAESTTPSSPSAASSEPIVPPATAEAAGPPAPPGPETPGGAPPAGPEPPETWTPPPGWRETLARTPDAPDVPANAPVAPAELGGNWMYDVPVPDRGSLGHNVQRDHVIAQAKLRDIMTDPSGVRHYDPNTLTVLAETGRATETRGPLPHTEATFHASQNDIAEIARLRAQGGPRFWSDDIVEPSRNARLASGYDPQAVDRGWVDQLGHLNAQSTLAETGAEVARLQTAGGQPLEPFPDIESMNWSDFSEYQPPPAGTPPGTEPPGGSPPPAPPGGGGPSSPPAPTGLPVSEDANFRNQNPVPRPEFEQMRNQTVQMGMPRENVVYSDTQYTQYIPELDMLIIGTDVHPRPPEERPVVPHNPANAALEAPEVLGHEIHGHREAALAGMTHSVPAAEEAQASYRAAKFTKDLSPEGRIRLLQDMNARLRNFKAGETVYFFTDPVEPPPFRDFGPPPPPPPMEAIDRPTPASGASPTVVVAPELLAPSTPAGEPAAPGPPSSTVPTAGTTPTPVAETPAPSRGVPRTSTVPASIPSPSPLPNPPIAAPLPTSGVQGTSTSPVPHAGPTGMPNSSPPGAATIPSSPAQDAHQPEESARWAGVTGFGENLKHTYLPFIYGWGEKGPTHEQQEQARRARFTADNQPAEGVERANPAYPDPPGTPEQIEAIKQEIANILDARARAEQSRQASAATAEAHEAQRGPIQQAQQDNQHQITATQAHAQQVAHRQQLNQEQKQRQQESQGLVAGYPSRATGLQQLTIPLMAFAGITKLGSYLPSSAGDKMAAMHEDSTKILAAFEQMAASMVTQNDAQPARKQELQSDGTRLDTTHQKSVESKGTFEKTGKGVDQVRQENEDHIADSRQDEADAADQCSELDDAAAKKQDKATSLAQQLQSWAAEHRAARQAAIQKTVEKIQARGLVVVEVKDI